MEGEISLFDWTIALLMIALIAAILGFGGIAGIVIGFARIVFWIFLVLWVLSIIFRGWSKL